MSAEAFDRLCQQILQRLQNGEEVMYYHQHQLMEHMYDTIHEESYSESPKSFHSLAHFIKQEVGCDRQKTLEPDRAFNLGILWCAIMMVDWGENIWS